MLKCSNQGRRFPSIIAGVYSKMFCVRADDIMLIQPQCDILLVFDVFKLTNVSREIGSVNSKCKDCILHIRKCIGRANYAIIVPVVMMLQETLSKPIASCKNVFEVPI